MGIRYDPGATFRIRPDPEDQPNDAPPDPNAEKEANRPYVLLTPCHDDSEVVTLAYCSTKDTQAALGAACVHIERTSSLFHLSGFDASTFVYPSRLVTAVPEDLIHLGRVIDELRELRGTELPRALGVGTGTYSAGAARGSWRGLVLELNASGQEAAHTNYAIVVSDPEYSKQAEYFNVIPLYPTDMVVHLSPDLVFPSTHSWVAQLGWSSALAAVRFVFGLHHDDDILRPRREAVDIESMTRIDEALGVWFDCW